MIIGNYMLLSEINPKQGFRWFMEFSCDSYEWVMHQNVYEMVFFISGGKTMRRPYFSSSNYVLNMSNYKKSKFKNNKNEKIKVRENNKVKFNQIDKFKDNWNDTWDFKYKSFIKKYNKELHKYRYFYK